MPPGATIFLLCAPCDPTVLTAGDLITFLICAETDDASSSVFMSVACLLACAPGYGDPARYVVSREYLLLPVSSVFTSHTKPGPNMELAVTTISRLRLSMEEKEVSSSFLSASGIEVSFGERQEKKKWLLCAIEA